SRRPGFPVQETHFAEEPPGTHALMTLRRHLDPGGTINDEEEMIAGLSRTREDLPGRGLQHRGDPADRAKLAHRAVLQDGYALQIADVLILTGLGSGNKPSLARLVRGIGNRAVHHATHMRPTISMTRLLYSIACCASISSGAIRTQGKGAPARRGLLGPSTIAAIVSHSTLDIS